MRRPTPFQIALLGVAISAILSCTPLPDIEDDKPLVPNPLSSIDAAACDSEAAPSICDQLRR
jgi:hypothetical protein